MANKPFIFSIQNRNHQYKSKYFLRFYLSIVFGIVLVLSEKVNEKYYADMKKLLTSLLTLSLIATVGIAAQSGWRKMTEKELRSAVPEKAQVINERIETEFRTASGIKDGRGHSIYGVVIITAGYEAEGKYTHYFVTQTTLKVGDFTLEPGEYVFGYQRTDAETLRATFYRAKNGDKVGEVPAKVESKKGPVYSFLITPPVGNKGTMQIGRFVFSYNTTE